MYPLAGNDIAELRRPVFDDFRRYMHFNHLFSDDVTGWLKVRVFQTLIRRRYLVGFRWFLPFTSMMDVAWLSARVKAGLLSAVMIYGFVYNGKHFRIR